MTKKTSSRNLAKKFEYFLFTFATKKNQQNTVISICFAWSLAVLFGGSDVILFCKIYYYE